MRQGESTVFFYLITQSSLFLWPLLTFLKSNEISHNFCLGHTHFYRYKWTIKTQTIINIAESETATSYRSICTY